MRNIDWKSVAAHLIGSSIFVSLMLWAAIYRLDH